jgi:uncharacterized protein (DUF2267 family)
MRYDEFLDRVAAVAGIGEDEAARSSEAVLRTLADRIGAKEARDTASQLPKELKAALEPAVDNAGAFDAHEFVRRVAERAGVDTHAARVRTRAVFVALREAVSEGERLDWELDLSTDYVDLAARPAETGGQPRGAHPGTRGHGLVGLGAQELVGQVADRAGLDEQRSRRAIDAVLEAFGESIAAGQAADLAAQLPELAAEALLRPGGDAHPAPLDAFVRTVAAREGELEAIAREHARAVLTTVREAVTADEWHDTLAELPRDYESVLAPA